MLTFNRIPLFLACAALAFGGCGGGDDADPKNNAERFEGDEKQVAEVVDRLGAELRAAVPGMRGLSPANLRAMQAFAAAWPDPAAAPPLDQLPWGHIRILLTEVPDPATRDWYVAATVQHGWSHDMLHHQILARSHLHAPV